MKVTEYTLKQKAKRIHAIFHSVTPVFDCKNSSVTEILQNIPETAGLMIFFEKNEDAFGMSRITYVGDTGNLKERVSAHLKFHSKLTDLINKSLPKNYAQGLQYPKNANKYIQENMTFVIFEIKDAKERNSLKNNILYTLSEYNASWIGINSIDSIISKYRLWASDYRKLGKIITDSELDKLEMFIKGEYCSEEIKITIDELRENARTLDSYLENANEDEKKFAQTLIRKGRCFLYDEKPDGFKFYPSRFMGYPKNTKEKHEIARANKTADGKITNPSINKAMQCKPTASEKLEKAYNNYCKILGVEPIYPPKFWLKKLSDSNF